MTAIREELFELCVEWLGRRKDGDGLRTAICAWLGIDPDADQDSILVLERPKCSTCDGSRVLPTPPHLAPSGYTYPCTTCKGTGYVPAEWATVDRCLDWLNERIAWDTYEYGPTSDGGYYVLLGIGSSAVGRKEVAAPTLHAALIAACRAVSQREVLIEGSD